MYIFKYFLSILFLLFLNTALIAQVRGKLELLADNKTYQVSITPEQTLSLRFSSTPNAQITLVAPAGGLVISNFQSISGNWEVGSSVVESPIENHNFSYYFIKLSNVMGDIQYEAGQDIILFTFENALACIGNISIIDDNNDPFLPPNSLMLNVGNLFSVVGYGQTNAYLGSTIKDAPCPEELDATATITANNLPCHDDVTSMTINIDGGEPPYLIKWTNTNRNTIDSIISNQLNTPITLQNILGGNYDIEIMDAKNANINISQNIIAPAPIELNLEITFSNCEESKDGAIEILDYQGGTGGPGDFQFDWSNGLNSTTLINNLDAGDYEVTVTDANGCQTVEQAVVKMDGWIEFEATPTDVSCFNLGDGSIATTASGKNPPFTYNWEASNGAIGTDNNLNNLQPGNYLITVTDATGICNQTTEVMVEEPAEIMATALIDSSSICELRTDNTITIDQVLNNRGPVAYAIDGINFSNSNQFVVNAGESYTITVQDEAACTADIDVDVPAPSGLEINLPPELIVRLGEDMQLEPNIESSSDINMLWTPADGLSCTNCETPTAIPTRTTTYTLTVSDDNGCVKEASVIVYLSTTRRVYAPNAFSPNSDGKNDRFTIFTSTDALSVNTLQIFNRWGERVYVSSSDFKASDEFNYGWNGNFNGKKAPSGTYVFMAEISFIDGKTEIFKGEVNLIR